jgi:hypothetical protein
MVTVVEIRYTPTRLRILRRAASGVYRVTAARRLGLTRYRVKNGIDAAEPVEAHTVLTLWRGRLLTTDQPDAENARLRLTDFGRGQLVKWIRREGRERETREGEDT